MPSQYQHIATDRTAESAPWRSAILTFVSSSPDANNVIDQGRSGEFSNYNIITDFPQTTGKLMVLAVWYAGTTSATVSDTSGNTWVKKVEISSNGNTMQVFYAVGNGTGNITITSSAADANTTIAIIKSFTSTGSFSYEDSASASGAAGVAASVSVTTATERPLVFNCVGVDGIETTDAGVPWQYWTGAPSNWNGTSIGGPSTLSIGYYWVTPGTVEAIPGPTPTVRCAGVQASTQLPSVEITRDLDADWKRDSTFIITQDEPLPFTLRGIVLRLTYEPD